jgi:formylglycine-generating enzyme required for sulfatase activity
MSEKDELAKVEAAIQAQEGFRNLLGDEVVDANIAILKKQLASHQAERSVRVDGDVKDSIIATGDFNEINLQQPQPDEASLHAAYLNHVYEQTSQLALAGIDKRTQRDAEARLNLGSVYTALLTLSSAELENLNNGKHAEAAEILERESSHRSSALAHLNTHNRLVLLGDPGSGKTTFVNFVALCLTGASLNQRPNLADLTTPLPPDEDERRLNRDKKPDPQPWDHGDLLPARVILRDFAARGLPPVGQKASAKDLIKFISAELESSALGDYARLLQRHLREKGGLLMLDGLDEVPEAEYRREQIKAVVEDFASTHPKCRILVTSRTYAYQKQDWRLNGFREVILAPFSKRQIEQFVERWYAHIALLRNLNEDDARGRAELLKRAIANSDRLRGLAERPLLLTLMASLHAWRGGTLPEKREELYADTVDLLLDWWESQRIVRDTKGEISLIQPSLAEWLKVDRNKVRALLNKLAYQAHSAQKELTGTADVGESDLINGLMQLSQNPDVKPKRLVEFLTTRAGLLLPRGVGVYTFPHRTFQEYLAACYLTDHGYPDEIAKITREDANRWREVCLLAGAKATRGGAFALWPLVDALCPQSPHDKADNDDFWGALLAGQAILENANGDNLSAANRQKQERVRDWQISILSSDLPPIERALAGDSLAALGDTRFDEAAWYLPREENLGFVQIPAGEFIMGSDDGRDEEKPQHTVTLPDYWIAKYPVTVAQFRAFTKATNYTDFSEHALSDSNNRPMRYVTWYNALAYTEWLSEELSGFSKQGVGKGTFWEGIAVGKLHVTLPSEAEWEKAARGPSTGSGTGRVYPWGNEFDLNKVNNRDTGIGTTSAVGCFPTGGSPYGLQDMSGNIWEWTRSLWGKDYQLEYKYPYDPGDKKRENLVAERNIARVLRGGSFLNDQLDVRCAYRDFGFPNHWNYSFGFRIVVSPFLSS